jgi:pyruvate formate lyase activating enzyme
MEGLVFDIQRFSIHDGPGIRTTVFLQGCNLRCFWCHNPESGPMGAKVQFFPDKCIACGLCVEACPEGAQILANGRRVYVRGLCKACGRCVDQCFARALVARARTMSVEQVLAEIDKDRPYYKDSNGGVTFSGGEPLLQPVFVQTLVTACRDSGLHVAVDTAANVPWESIEPLIGVADLFLVDVKAVDEAKHREGTGVGNQRIHSNLRRLVESGATVWVRVPVIPDFNDDGQEAGRIADFLASMPGIARVDLLPFHHLGAGKYESLGLEYPSRLLQPPRDSRMNDLVRLFTERGLAVQREA